MVLRTQSPTDRRDLLVLQVRETVMVLKGTKSRSSSQARSIQRTGKAGGCGTANGARLGDVWLPESGRTALARRVRQNVCCSQGRSCLPSCPTLYHLLGGAWSRPWRYVLTARERKEPQFTIGAKQQCEASGSSYSRQHK